MGRRNSGLQYFAAAPSQASVGTLSLNACGYAWPGNVRELRNVIERAHVLNDLLAAFPQLTPVESVISQGADSPKVIVYRIRIRGVSGVVEG